MKNPDNVARGRRSKARSKTYERSWAAVFHTSRETDGRGLSLPDAFITLPDGRVLGLEVKSRVSANVGALMDEAIKKVAGTDVPPVLGLELRRPGGNRRLVVMEQADFHALLFPS